MKLSKKSYSKMAMQSLLGRQKAFIEKWNVHPLEKKIDSLENELYDSNNTIRQIIKFATFADGEGHLCSIAVSGSGIMTGNEEQAPSPRSKKLTFEELREEIISMRLGRK